MAEDKPTAPEAQNEDSHFRQTYSSPIKTPLAPIDPEKCDEWIKHVYPHVNEQIAWNEMVLKLCPEYSGSQVLEAPPPGNSHYCDYLNHLSTTFIANYSS